MSRTTAPSLPHRSPVSAGGFTLLEILVAFMLMALIISVLLRVFSGGLQGIGRAEEYAQASSVAESLLARVGNDILLKDGETSGVANEHYRWSVRIKPHEIAGPEGSGLQPQTPVSLFEVKVAVAWAEQGRERQVTLESLRLGQRT